jgi:hypothetical protein
MSIAAASGGQAPRSEYVRTRSVIGVQCSASAARPMNRPRCPASARSRDMCSAGVETRSASAQTCSGGVMWSLMPASRKIGQSTADKFTRLPSTTGTPRASSLWTNRCGQILRPFEPVGEVDVPSRVVGIADVGEKARQAPELSARLQQLEPG